VTSGVFGIWLGVGADVIVGRCTGSCDLVAGCCVRVTRVF